MRPYTDSLIFQCTKYNGGSTVAADSYRLLYITGREQAAVTFVRWDAAVSTALRSCNCWRARRALKNVCGGAITSATTTSCDTSCHQRQAGNQTVLCWRSNSRSFVFAAVPLKTMRTNLPNNVTTTRDDVGQGRGGSNSILVPGTEKSVICDEEPAFSEQKSDKITDFAEKK